MKIDSEELEAFVNSAVKSIMKGLEGTGAQVRGQIEFEVAVVNVKRGEGGIKLLVADASGKYEKEVVTKIKFRVGPKDTKLGDAR